MLEAAFYFVLTMVAKSFTIKGKVSVNIVFSLSIYSRYILFKEGQTLSLCHIFKIQCFAETFTIHVALCFDLILFTTQGASRIFLNIIETGLASHLIVYRLYFSLSIVGRKKRTTWSYHFIWMSGSFWQQSSRLTKLASVHFFLKVRCCLLSVEWLIHGYTALGELALLNEQNFEENKKGLPLFCLWKIT